MHNFAAFLLLPLTLALSAPIAGGGPAEVPVGGVAAQLGTGPGLPMPAMGAGAMPSAPSPFAPSPFAPPPFALPPFALPPPAQVRIERRVIIRISPARPMPAMRPDTLVPAPIAENRPVRLVERRMGRCIDADTIAGIRPRGDDQLLIYLRDRTMVSAQLDGRCRGRMFYSGAYAERGDDGKICVARDRLQSRAGASCGIERFHRLVPAD